MLHGKKLTPLLLLAFQATVGAPHSAASIVGQWLFNNPSLVDDSSGNGLTLTPVGDPLFDPNARGGLGAVSLDGSSYFTIDPFPNGIPIGGSDYTITAWINTTDTGRDGIIGWGDYGTQNQVNAFRVLSQAEGDGIINYWWADDDYFRGDNVADGSWHSVAVTYNGSVRTIYIDGVSQSFAGSGIDSQPTDFTIGQTLGSEYFIGELSDVEVFNTALTQAQVSQLDGAVPEPATFFLAVPALLLCRRKRSEA